MEVRPRIYPSKRVFGKDITNLERRNKASSICEKAQQFPEYRPKANSFDKKITQEHKDPIHQYEHTILNFMLSLQNKEKKQLMIGINEDMRMILIDWLVDVHQSFELKEQTLFLALHYLNLYSAQKEITKQQYQLVGITCLWIASKYEEIYPPRMQNYVQVTDSSYTLSQMKNMEGKILLALNFNLNHTTSLQILQMLADKWPKDGNKLSRESLRSLCMSKYLLELGLMNGLGKLYCTKTLVLSSLMLNDSIFKTKSDSKLLDNDKIQKQSLMGCFKQLCLILQNICKQTNKFKAIKKKYTDQKYLAVARYRIQPK